MNCMRKLFIINNFIIECIGQDILRERTWGAVGFTPCFIFFFLHTKNFVQIVPKINWILSEIYEIMHLWRHCQTHNFIISIIVIQPVIYLFIRLFTNTNRYLIETLSLYRLNHIQFPLWITCEWSEKRNWYSRIHIEVVPAKYNYKSKIKD